MNDDQYWFKFRVAICNRELENYEEAVKDFKEVLKYKSIWSNQKELAETYYLMNEIDTALKVCIESALNNSKVILDKVKLYELMELIFMEKGMEKEAQNIAFLIHTIRLNDNSNIVDNESAYELEKAGYDISNIDYVALERDLRDDWENILDDLE